MHPVFLQITTYGWTGLALLVLAVICGVRIVKRSRSPKRGCVAVGYVSLVVFLIFCFTGGIGGMIGGFVYNAFTLPRYQARVVDHDSYVSESRDRDSRRTRRTTMYQPIVEFRDDRGNAVHLKSDVASSSPENIGATLTVGYRPGMTKVVAFSMGKYILVGGGAVMLLVLLYCSVAAIAYAMGAPMKKLTQLGVNLIMFFLIPVAMLAFIAGLGYAVIAYFKGDKPDMPLWALAICIFFLLVLLPSFYGYVRLLFSRKLIR